jgi:hypothetical protein
VRIVDQQVVPPTVKISELNDKGLPVRALKKKKKVDPRDFANLMRSGMIANQNEKYKDKAHVIVEETITKEC